MQSCNKVLCRSVSAELRHDFTRVEACLLSSRNTKTLRGVRQHLTKNNILSHGLRLLSSNHVKEFGVFFLHWNPTPSYWKLLVPETRSPQPQKLPAHSFYKRCCHEAANGKVVSNNWCYRQAALLHPQNVSRPFARQIQHDAGQRPPQGNIYQLLHLDPLVLTLDLLPWQTPFTSLLLHLTGNGIDRCVLRDGCSLYITVVIILKKGTVKRHLDTTYKGYS